MSKKPKEKEEVIDLTGDEVTLSPEDVSSMSMFQDVATREEAMAKVAILLAQPERRKMMSELSKNQVMMLSCLYAVSEGLKEDYPDVSKTIERFAKEYLELMISNSRKGRKEIMKVASSLSMEYERRSMMSRMNPMNWFGRG